MVITSTATGVLDIVLFAVDALNTLGQPVSAWTRAMQVCWMEALGFGGKNVCYSITRMQRRANSSTHRSRHERFARLVNMCQIPSVVLLVEGLVFDVCGNLVDLRTCPAQHAAERSQAEREDTLRDGQIVPAGHRLLMFILVPGIQGQSDSLVIDLGEASFLQSSYGFTRAVRNGSLGGLGRVLECLVPARQSAPGVFALAARLEIDLELLEPATGSEVLVDATVEAGPAADAAGAHLHVDDIPGIITQSPGGFKVEGGVEIAVLGIIGRLDCSEVAADHKGVGELFGHFDAPDSCATAQV